MHAGGVHGSFLELLPAKGVWIASSVSAKKTKSRVPPGVAATETSGRPEVRKG
jgi:hypothetical protein